jgi:hypothetical protein
MKRNIVKIGQPWKANVDAHYPAIPGFLLNGLAPQRLKDQHVDGARGCARRPKAALAQPLR